MRVTTPREEKYQAPKHDEPSLFPSLTSLGSVATVQNRGRSTSKSPRLSQFSGIGSSLLSFLEILCWRPASRISKSTVTVDSRKIPCASLWDIVYKLGIPETGSLSRWKQKSIINRPLKTGG